MSALPTLRSARGSRRAFTLLELVVCVAILAVLAAAAVPVTSKVLDYKASQATRDELGVLSDAAADYFQDVGQLPSKLDDLLVNPGSKSAPGWAGPYLPGVVADQLSKQEGYLLDGWSTPYELKSTGDVLTIASPGQDGKSGDDDDIALALDVTWIRRDQTLRRLAIVNQAILHYNSLYQVSDPLPLSYSSAQKKLVNVNLLPDDADFSVDAWGDPFVADPQGVLPVVRVNSVHLLPGSGSSGSGNSGKANGKGKPRGKKGGKSNNAGGNSNNAGGNSNNAGGKSSNAGDNSNNAGGNSSSANGNASGSNGNSGNSNGNSGQGNSGKGNNF